MADVYPFLARLAHLPGRKADPALKAALETFTGWAALIPQAEMHGLAPLVYRHAQLCGAHIPAEARLQLQGLYLRHKYANESLTAVSAEILAALGRAGIEALLLKGAALAHTVYPEPGLRPMRDVDILVPAAQAEEAQTVLLGIGFRATGIIEKLSANHRHLDVLQLERNGHIVSVEIHQYLLSGLLSQGQKKRLADLRRPFLAFAVGETAAFTLNPDEMLWHLYRHMVLEPARLVRLVDIVGFAGKFARQIDWDFVRATYPGALAALSLLHFVSPLPAELRQAAGIEIGPKPAGAERPLQDWPPVPRARWSQMRKRDVLAQTFFPSEFSLRMYYGIDSHRSIFWHRWLWHPWQIARWAVLRRLARERQA